MAAPVNGPVNVSATKRFLTERFRPERFRPPAVHLSPVLDCMRIGCRGCFTPAPRHDGFHAGLPRACSSVGQSGGLIIRWSKVRVLPGPPIQIKHFRPFYTEKQGVARRSYKRAALADAWNACLSGGEGQAMKPRRPIPRLCNAPSSGKSAHTTAANAPADSCALPASATGTATVARLWEAATCADATPARGYLSRRGCWPGRHVRVPLPATVRRHGARFRIAPPADRGHPGGKVEATSPA